MMKAGTGGDQVGGDDLQDAEAPDEELLGLLGTPGDVEAVDEAGEPQNKSQGCVETKFPLESAKDLQADHTVRHS